MTYFNRNSALRRLLVSLLIVILVEGSQSVSWFSSSPIDDRCYKDLNIEDTRSQEYKDCVNSLTSLETETISKEMIKEVTSKFYHVKSKYSDLKSFLTELSDWNKETLIKALKTIPTPTSDLAIQIKKFGDWQWWQNYLDDTFEKKFNTFFYIDEITKNSENKAKIEIYLNWWKNKNELYLKKLKARVPAGNMIYCTYNKVQYVINYDIEKTKNKVSEEDYFRIYDTVCTSDNELGWTEDFLKDFLSNDYITKQPKILIEKFMSPDKLIGNILKNLHSLPPSVKEIWNDKAVSNLIAKFNKIEAADKLQAFNSMITLKNKASEWDNGNNIKLEPGYFTILWRHGHDNGLPRTIIKNVFQKLSMYRSITGSRSTLEDLKSLISAISHLYKLSTNQSDGMLKVLFLLEEAKNRNWPVFKIISFLKTFPGHRVTYDELIPFLQAVNEKNIDVVFNICNYFTSFNIPNIWKLLYENNYDNEDLNVFVTYDKDKPQTRKAISLVLKSTNPGCTYDELKALTEKVKNEVKNFPDDAYFEEIIKQICPDFVK